jgi:uncharacterized protein
MHDPSPPDPAPPGVPPESRAATESACSTPLPRCDAAPGPPVAPVAEGERIAVVDMLRGVALLGILSVNMAFFSTPLSQLIQPRPVWTDPADLAVYYGIVALAQGKFYVLFSFLFGLGMFIQDRRSAQRGDAFAARFVRRLLVLLVIGLVHAFFIWAGDILACYAVLGFFLLVLRLLPNRWLLVVAGALAAVPLMMTLAGVALLLLVQALDAPSPGNEEAAVALSASASAPATQAAATQVAATAAPGPATRPARPGFAWDDSGELERMTERALTAYRGGTFGAIMRQRAIDVAFVWFFLVTIAPQILALFLLGIYAGRIGLFEDLRRYHGVFGIGLAVFLPLGLAANGLAAWLTPHTDYSRAGLLIAQSVLGIIGGPVLSFGYVSAIVLLAQQPRWRPWLSPLSDVGRMALSNYLLQSLVCTFIFYRYDFGSFQLGLGQFGYRGPAAWLVLTVAIFVCQVPLSVLWLRAFRFGPMEWLWRSLTYGRLQPLRRRAGD